MRRLGTLTRKAVSLLLALTLCLGCVSFAAAEEGEKSAAPTRTILLYACGSNLETNYGMATWNLYQILAAEIPEGINVVVLAGGSEAWQTEPEYLEGAESVCADGKNEIWVCSGKNAANAENGHGKMTLQNDMPEELADAFLSSGETLRVFIDYAAEKFPAQIYDLILWDHGGGPQYGFGIDEHDPNESIMSVGAIAKALKESKVEHFDFVDFDACLMSSVEIAACLSEYADYLILSAETEPGYGQEYTTWLNALAADPGMNGFDLGRIIVDAFVAFYEDPESEGYGQGGTLAVIDTKAFRERLMPEITELARIMDRELTTVGHNNLLLNFQDEYRSQAVAYPYYDTDLLDIGSFAEHLGICMSEIDNQGYIDTATMTNAYSEVAGSIREILADMDNSGDDVIYFKATQDMTVPVTASVAYTRNAEGELERVEQMSPSGMSIFFTPASMTTMTYMAAMNEMLDMVEDEGVKELLKAVEAVSLRYLLTTAAGTRVDSLKDAGEANVFYGTVRDSWKNPRELTRSEIYTYADTLGLGYSVDITAMEASDWRAYVGQVVDWLDENTDVNTDTWLALLVAQQSSMSFDKSRTSAIALDMDGDGEMDAGRVTLPVPLSLVKGVSLSIKYKLNGEYAVEIGRVGGTPVTDQAVLNYAEYEDMGYAVMNLYDADTCAFDIPAVLDKWYELLDSDGLGHMIALTDMDSVRTSELKIPVAIQFDEVDEDGYPVTEVGYLIYKSGHFVGFLEAYSGSPVVSLTNKRFDGAVVHPALAYPLFGLFYLFIPLTDDDPGFQLDAARTEDRGMRLVMTSVDEINALQDNPLEISVVATDLYGYDHNINEVLEAAKAAAADGTMLRSVEKAKVRCGELTYNRKRQDPPFTVTVGDTELVKDQDYVVVGEQMFRAGTQSFIIVGIGNYVGVTEAECTLVRAESTVEAVSAVAAEEIAGAGKTILTANTPAHPENITFDFSETAEALQQYLEISEDGRSVILQKGAAEGSYVIKVTVAGGAEDTYTDIEGESFTITVGTAGAGE